jgi:hypothetical protein
MRKACMFFALVACLLTTTVATARCYFFTNGGAICVCIKGDSYEHRKRARDVCGKVKGSHCGAVSRSADGCQSKKKKCYDEEGNAHESLSGY